MMAVAAHLQEDRGQDHRTCGWGLDMGVRQPGVHRPHRQLDREGSEKCQPGPGLQVARHRGVHQGRNVGGAGIPVQRHDRQQHQDRAQQRVEEKLEGGIDPARPTPHSDDQEHRDQAAFEEQIEQHEIERAEGADHQRFQEQKRHHVFAHAHRYRFPARQNADRHQCGGQDHEWQRDAVNAHMIGDGIGKPRRFLDELKVRLRRIETPDQDQRHRKGDQRRPQRDPTRITPGRFIVAAADIDDQRAEHRQEGDEGENRPGRHHWPPKPNMNQVISPATDVPVADFPQETSEPLRRANEDQLIELVEIPFVEKELVEHLVLVGEFLRNVGPADIEDVRHIGADRHHLRRE